MEFTLCSSKFPDKSDVDLEQLRAQNSHLMAVLNYIIFIPVKNRRGSDRPESHVLLADQHDLFKTAALFFFLKKRAGRQLLHVRVRFMLLDHALIMF